MKQTVRKTAGRWLAILMLLLPALTITADKRNGDIAYKKGNYQQAIADYQSVLAKGVSAELYYNLGNAYYRSDSLAQAILAYERAYKLSPGDGDINFNLQFARSKTIDKIVPESEVIFVKWYHSVVNFTSADTWAKTGVVAIILALVLMLIYLFAAPLTLRKVGFYGSAALLVVFVLSQYFAWDQKRHLLHDDGAIIMVPTVSVKKTPVANSQDAFVLHEGTRVKVTDTSIKQWMGITLSDGREGWIPADRLTMI